MRVVATETWTDHNVTKGEIRTVDHVFQRYGIAFYHFKDGSDAPQDLWEEKDPLEEWEEDIAKKYALIRNMISFAHDLFESPDKETMIDAAVLGKIGNDINRWAVEINTLQRGSDAVKRVRDLHIAAITTQVK